MNAIDLHQVDKERRRKKSRQRLSSLSCDTAVTILHQIRGVGHLVEKIGDVVFMVRFHMGHGRARVLV